MQLNYNFEYGFKITRTAKKIPFTIVDGIFYLFTINYSLFTKIVS